EQRLAAIESAALGMEFSFQAQDHNAFAISIVRSLVALPPCGTCYSAPNICSSQPELRWRGRRPLHCGISALFLSALGQERTSPVHLAMSALPLKADPAPACH